MPVLNCLLEPEAYQPALWDLSGDRTLVAHWREVFELQLDDMLALLAQHRSSLELERARAARDQLLGLLHQPDPAWLGAHSTVHAWTLERERLLARHGVDDPYRELKQRENRRALELLPGLLAETLSGAPLQRSLPALLSLMFAGNLFDLGSPAVGRSLPDGQDLLAEADRLARRTPLFDDRVRLGERLQSLCAGGQTAVMLVDNAGPDFVCGCLPLAALLASRGARVILAANHTPSLNDITCGEARQLLQTAAAATPALPPLLECGALRLVDSGNTTPGIDLRQVSSELDRACAQAQLLVLVGQGRAVETNWWARIDRDCLRVATLKDPRVAATLAGVPGDTLVELRPAGRPAPVA